MVNTVSFMGGRNTCLSKAEAEKMVKQLTKNREAGIHPEQIVKAEEAARFTSPSAGINVKMPEGIEKLASKEAVNVYPGIPLN